VSAFVRDVREYVKDRFTSAINDVLEDFLEKAD
jgi:hypothetical protein